MKQPSKGLGLLRLSAIGQCALAGAGPTVGGGPVGFLPGATRVAKIGVDEDKDR